MRRAALWVAIVLGYLYTANDGPVPGAFFLLCVSVIYLLVVFVPRARRTTTGL
jgi:hypothetical protein